MVDKEEVGRLVNEWIKTLDDYEDYWDGFFASDRELAKMFLINNAGCRTVPSISFLEWLDKREDSNEKK